jgi:hypothetical protein
MRRRSMIAAVAATMAAAGIAASSAAADGGQLPPSPPVKLDVQSTPGAQLAPGFIFIDPHQVVDTVPTGPMIIDNAGRVRWYHQVADGESASNFRVQRYHGKPVLTWWEGSGNNPAFGAFAPGIGQGKDVIMDDHYRVVATIPATADFSPDTHEFELTSRGTALITGYRTVPNVDLTSVGGPANGTVIDSVLREVDVKTGKVLLEWSALAHVPVTDSHALPLLGASPWDFFHINSISVAPDGNLLISARHMWALYEIDRHTGDIVWTLGGKHSSFTVPADATFAWQHDPRFVSRDEIRLFDNEAGVPFPPAGPRSRALWLHLDYKAHTASLVRSIEQPADQRETQSQGSVQSLPNGNTLVGWGDAGTFSEHDSAGNLLLRDTLPPPQGTVTLPGGLTVPNTWSTYRVFKSPWTATPTEPPAVAVQRTSAGHYTVSAAWNGATDVTRWLVLAGPDRHHLRPVASAPWDGLITRIDVAGDDIGVVQVKALADDGAVLGCSAAVSVGA